MSAIRARVAAGRGSLGTTEERAVARGSRAKAASGSSSRGGGETLDGQSDGDLCDLAAAGDRDAFAALYGRHHAAIWRLVSASGVPADATPDVVQETFARALSAFSRGRRPDRCALWLRAIALNLVRDRWRRPGSRRERSVDPQAQPDRPAPAADADDAVVVRQALAAMAADLREVVVLHFYQGLTLAEVAEVAGMPIGTVKSRLSRAYRRLSEALGPDVGVSRRREVGR